MLQVLILLPAPPELRFASRSETFKPVLGESFGVASFSSSPHRRLQANKSVCEEITRLSDVLILPFAVSGNIRHMLQVLISFNPLHAFGPF